MGSLSDGGSENIDWDTEDELEIENIPTSSSVLARDSEAIAGQREVNGTAGPSKSKCIQHFLGMGFSEQLIEAAIKENGEENTELILETLLTHAVLEDSPEQVNPSERQECINTDQLSSDCEENYLDVLSDSDWSDDEIIETTGASPDQDKTIATLASMGYNKEEASLAMERCGPEASLSVLTDFLCAVQMSRTDEAFFQELPKKPKHIFGSNLKKRKLHEYKIKRVPQVGDMEPIRIPKPMVGFGVPTEPGEIICYRSLPEAAKGPPYFYYENVALTPKGVWDTISRFLYDVEPEFVDSKYFCAAARKRGYIHNLPIHNRYLLRPPPPRTIHEALPLTKKWWPEWDKRTKLNCLVTCIASAKLTERIRKDLEKWGDVPPKKVQDDVLHLCKKWNLVWVGKNKLAPLEPDEVEMLLGFPKNHTRGGGISRTDRYKSLGNSFQVDTVAYHLSTLKEIFPNGVNVLSLFSGIGGAEVALHRLGVPLLNVVSVEKSEASRSIVQSWWEQTNQQGNLFHLDDVQDLDAEKLEHFIGSFGGFDLVVGGSPCNNLTGSNRHHRDGLEGEHSSLFYDYFRILDLVKCIMKR